MKISKISRDVSRDFENYIFGKFLSNVYSQYSSFSRELFFLTLKTTFLFFFFFENFSSPRINRTTRPTAFYRSSKFCRRYRGSIMRKPARIYESNIRRTHSQTARRRNKAFRTVALLYWSNSLSLSLSLSLLLLLAILSHKTSYPFLSCRWTRKKKKKKRDERSHPPSPPPPLVGDIYLVNLSISNEVS